MNLIAKLFNTVFTAMFWIVIITGLSCNRPEVNDQQAKPKLNEAIPMTSTDSRSPSSLFQDRAAFLFVNEFQSEIQVKGRVKSEDFQRLFQIAQQYPDDQDLQSVLVKAIIIRQDWDGLVDYYLNRPVEKRAHDELLSAMMKAHRYEEVWNYLNDELANDKSSDFRQIQLSLAAFHTGRFEESEQIVEQLLATANVNAEMELIFLRGRLALRQERWEEAENYLRRANEMSPDTPNIMINFSRALRQLNRASAANELETRAKEIQQEIDRLDAIQRRMAALANNLEKFWGEKNLEKCLEIIEEMEPHVDATVRRGLDGYRQEIYRMREEQ